MPARTDWLLLTLAQREGKPLSPVQVQKALFLLSQEMPQSVGKDFYSFKPYNYGPFDVAIYHDMDALAQMGLVRIDGAGSWRRFEITAAGMEYVKAIMGKVDGHGREYLGRAVAWVASLSFTDLVRSIYAKYPAYRKNSVFVG